jgi:hypothetical protein
MHKCLSAVFLLPMSFGTHAACRSFDGNWIMQTTLSSSSLTTLGLAMSSGIAHVNISGSTISFLSGTEVELAAAGTSGSGTVGAGGPTYTVVGSDSESSVSRLDSGSGTVAVNPSNCRVTINWTSRFTVFTSNGQSAQTSLGRAKGDSVKLTKGLAGRYIRTANGTLSPGTFELSPE